VTSKAEYFKFFTNSVYITLAAIFGQVVIGIFAAFAFAKIEFKGRNIIFGIYVLAILLPFQVTLVPNYLMLDKIQMVTGVKLFDTHWAIILPGIFSSFGIFLLRQFIRGIPNETIESARMDGAGYLRILFKIIIPMIKPALFTLVLLTFIDNWNLIEQAIIFINTPAKMPLSVFLDNIYKSDFGVFFAGAVLYLLPAVYLFIKGEKFLNEGLIISSK
jgi:multiple sugar transport system permease protein